MLTSPVFLKKHTLELSQVCPSQSFSVRSTHTALQSLCVCVCARVWGSWGVGHCSDICLLTTPALRASGQDNC